MTSDPMTRRWAALGRVLAAHAVMLRDTGLIGDEALAALLRGIDAARSGQPPAVDGLLAAVRAFDERAAALTPAGVAGALRVGRGDLDVAATVLRVVARDSVASFASTVDDAREALIALASSHLVTLTPAWIDGQTAQPTTVAHLLGRVIGPLGRAAGRFGSAAVELERSPMGAGALASSGMPIDRERVAELLGFDGVVENTFDALTAWDLFAEIASAAGGALRPVTLLLAELLVWMRIDPALVLPADRDARLLGDLPQARLPGALLDAIAAGQTAERALEAARAAALAMPFGPSASLLDGVADAFDAAIASAQTALARAAGLLSGGIELNRALLANRAGKGFGTSSDLADFLMIEERIEPGAARDIAALTISRTREQGLEASGVTPEIIDGAALLVIGREIKAEFEAISRYLAPRRFIERRAATGAPSPSAVRSYLETEAARLAASREEWQRRRSRYEAAAAGLSRLESEAFAGG